MNVERMTQQQRLAAQAAHMRHKGVTVCRQGDKMGRNDPCHCGSGKKYKKCCLAADEVRDGEFLRKAYGRGEEDA